MADQCCCCPRPVSFWTHWLKPLASGVRLSFYLFISNPAPFPLPPSSAFLELCPVDWSFCVVMYGADGAHFGFFFYFVSNVFLFINLFCITFKLRYQLLLFPSLILMAAPPHKPSPHSENEWCFYGRQRGLAFLRSRLIYPPPLSSCYARSLNFPFPVVLPVFIFPNSFFHTPWFPANSSSLFSAAVLFFLNLIWAPNMPCRTRFFMISQARMWYKRHRYTSGCVCFHWYLLVHSNPPLFKLASVLSRDK